MKRRASLILLLLLLAAAPAHANVYIPSLVEMLAAPLLWSIYGITMVITVPVILGVAAIEAKVLRRDAPGKRFRRLFAYLAVLNALTSLLGLFILPLGAGLQWAGLPIAYLISSVIEGLALRMINPGIPRPTPFLTFLKASFRMNAASYAVLTGALLGLIYLLMLWAESRTVARAATGTVIAMDGAEYRAISLSARRFPSLDEGKDEKLSGLSPAKAPFFHSITSQGFARVSYASGRWKRKEVRLARGRGQLVAISPDERLSVKRVSGSLWVVDNETGRLTRCLGKSREGHPFAVFSFDDRFLFYEPSYLMNLGTGKIKRLPCQLSSYSPARFNPVRPELAWEVEDQIAVCDCTTGRLKTLRLPGYLEPIAGGVAWSPDGRYLAYPGHANPFTHQNWYPDLRIVDAATGRSATVHRRVFTAGRSLELFWLP